MKQRVLIIICFLTLGQAVKAQYVLKQANEQYSLYNYSKAAELYLKAYQKNPTLYTAEHLANSYRLMRSYPEAEKWYATTVNMPNSSTDNILKYAEVLKNNLKYTEAKTQYTRYYTLSRGADQTQLKTWISSCDSAIKWMKSPVPVLIENEQALNTPESDWGAVRYQNTVVFTSDREVKPNKDEQKKKSPFYIKFDGNDGLDKRTYGWTGNKYLNLYESPLGANAADAVKLFPFIAGTDYHIGAASFTANGNEMFFTLTRLPKGKGKDTAKIKTITVEVYSSKRNAVTNRWETPVAFPLNKEEVYSVGDPFITADGKGLYFTSDMPGGLGGTDIYFCARTPDGTWAQPVNLAGVNTAGNERTPYLDAMGTLYFSTDGDKGMGGLDVFKAVQQGTSFGLKQNLGYPINSAQDDFAYVLVNDTAGYLSSNRMSGVGSDDIYSFSPLPVVSYQLQGVVYDKNSRKPIGNSVVTLSKTNGGKISVSTNASGQFNFKLYENTEYQLRGEKKGYLADNLNPFTTTGLEPGATVKKNLYLNKIEIKKTIRLENIYYDLDKSYIRPDAAVELDKLVAILKENPTLVIELGSHTDSRGDDDYNMALSRRRANEAVEYIITTGDIDEDRIIARGYGETRLLNRCRNGVQCSEAAHQLNRRTEFTIIKY
ncbi:OmpA family protein [Mucilaginibacter sp. PAMB04274]|uniref:OmpA family protein n=1 Tax=Mucilaginibacter sp. PAMB04274 TaxID=3138568 RepID=UPI0031F60628